MKNQFDNNMNKVYSKLTKGIMDEEIFDLDTTLLTFLYPRLLKLYEKKIHEEIRDENWLSKLQELIHNIRVILESDYKTEDPDIWQGFFIDKSTGKYNFNKLDDKALEAIHNRVQEEMDVQDNVKKLLSDLLFTLQII